MSLTFSDQHLAWQQRVGKEVITASKILQAFNQFPNYKKKSGRSTSLESRQVTSGSKNSKSINENLFQALQRTYMQSSLGVYSEVRGKYARPAPQLNQINKNPVLNRPATAGSLRPRTSRGLREETVAEKEVKKHDGEDLVKRPNSSLDFSMRNVSSRRSKRSKRSVSRSEIIKCDDKVEDQVGEGKTKKPTQDDLKIPIQQETPENPSQKIQETVKFDLPDTSKPLDDCAQPPIPEPLPEETQFPISETGSIPSTKTTSSHRRYISELENLLKEEQQKRKRLEDFLHTLISNNLK